MITLVAGQVWTPTKAARGRPPSYALDRLILRLTQDGIRVLRGDGTRFTATATSFRAWMSRTHATWKEDGVVISAAQN